MQKIVIVFLLSTVITIDIVAGPKSDYQVFYNIQEASSISCPQHLSPVQNSLSYMPSGTPSVSMIYYMNEGMATYRNNSSDLMKTSFSGTLAYNNITPLAGNVGVMVNPDNEDDDLPPPAALSLSGGLEVLGILLLLYLLCLRIKGGVKFFPW